MSSIFLLLFLFAVYFWATFTHCCESLWWLGATLHFLGGLGIATLTVSIFKDEIKSVSKPFIAFLMLGAAALTGALWELFEWSVDYFGILNLIPHPSLTDTMADLLMDILGAAFAVIIFLSKTHHKNK